MQALPDNYYQQYTKSVMAITADDVLRVAKQYIDLDHLAIVIVGDQKAIEEPLSATKIAPIAHLDIEGAPVAEFHRSSTSTPAHNRQPVFVRIVGRHSQRRGCAPFCVGTLPFFNAPPLRGSNHSTVNWPAAFERSSIVVPPEGRYTRYISFAFAKQ